MLLLENFALNAHIWFHNPILVLILKWKQIGHSAKRVLGNMIPMRRGWQFMHIWWNALVYVHNVFIFWILVKEFLDNEMKISISLFQPSCLSAFAFVHLCHTILFFHVCSFSCLIRRLLQLGYPCETGIPSNQHFCLDSFINQVFSMQEKG